MVKKQTIKIRVTAKIDGFWRGGLCHQGTKEYPVTAFSEDQLQRIYSEPLLIVEEIKDEQVSEAS